MRLPLFIHLLDRSTRPTPMIKGNLAEKRVAFIINRLIPKKGGYLINDILLPISEGKVTQVDHIYVSPYGVFVIETKALAGSIYGKTSDDNWVTFLSGQKYQIYNPVRQNALHVAALETNVKMPEEPISLVTILAANIKNVEAENVFNLPGLEKYLLGLEEEILLEDEVEDIYKQIMEFKEHPVMSKEEFLRSLRGKKS